MPLSFFIFRQIRGSGIIEMEKELKGCMERFAQIFLYLAERLPFRGIPSSKKFLFIILPIRDYFNRSFCQKCFIILLRIYLIFIIFPILENIQFLSYIVQTVYFVELGILRNSPLSGRRLFLDVRSRRAGIGGRRLLCGIY